MDTVAPRARLDELWAKGREFLGTEYAVLGGAMTWVSERNLVSALSNAGGFGVIACGAMTTELLDAEIAATAEMTSAPFGVNLITMHPDLEKLIDVCLDQNVGHIILAGGLPGAPAIKRAKGGGAKVVCFAPTLSLAKRVVRQGADALVIEGAEAGGHIGPVATSVLAQEILPHIEDVPVFIAGGIGRGDAVVAYLEMGASGCQLGTLFVCAEESIAHENFKKAFIRASARDAVPSVQLDPQFPVIPVRALQNDATREFQQTQRNMIDSVQRGDMEQNAAQLEIEHYWAGALRRAVVDGDVETGSLMAGQSVGMVKEVRPATTIIENLIDEAVEALAARDRTKASG
ncbi:MAG: 2-nitropropane dioxygenase [Rhodospirillaceae bacterium]|nr:2-nitropropane dioxygenase [Rhodospirillaceae bacterium]|tara:strand:+ start:110 stop:1147 length:1038 start_codon:yes stop_codon:yes gene_type:complete